MKLLAKEQALPSPAASAVGANLKYIKLLRLSFEMSSFVAYCLPFRFLPPSRACPPDWR